MSALLRWGFDRKAGARKRPVPLVRSAAEILQKFEVRIARARAAQKEARPREARADIGHGATVKESKQVEAMLPKPASVPVAVEGRDPPPAPLPPARAPKIVLAAAPSGMEVVARQWCRAAPSHAPLPPVPGDDGKVWCEGYDARVPPWFGRGCISGTCSLKGTL